MAISTVERRSPTDEAFASPCCGPHRFGRYLALPAKRDVLFDGRPICIGGRAFDLLILLLEHRGRVVGKEEIFRRVWPTTTVDESNLRFQMAALRRALGEGRRFIKTIPGRGYIFVTESNDGEAGLVPAAMALGEPQANEQTTLRDALCALVRTLRINPDAAATLEALPVDDRQGCRAGADDDRAAVLAAERAGPRDVDVVEHPHLGERPRAGLEFVACRWQPTACHAEAGVSIGGLGVVDARLGEDFPGALHDRAEGRLPGLDLQVGTAAIRFPEGTQIGVGEPHAAIGAAAVDAEVKPSHAGAPLLCKRSTCSFRRGP